MNRPIRTRNLTNKILNLLEGAKTHPEIESKLGKLRPFLKTINANDFINLMEMNGDSSPVYIVLWYHCCEMMRKATTKCALFSPERMIALYPMWRAFADESDGYGRPGRTIRVHKVVIQIDTGQTAKVPAAEPSKESEKNILDLSNHTAAEDECIDLAKHLSAALNSSQIPNSLKTVIANGISDLGSNNGELVKLLDSEEYITKVLCEEIQGGGK